MAAPTNTTAATAIAIGTTLPYSTTQTVDFGGTTYTVWYKYTAQAGDEVIGVFAFGDLTVYKPQCSIYAPDAVTPYLDGINNINAPLQFPVAAGTTYWMEIRPNGGNPTPASLSLSVLRSPHLTAASGQLVVPDDTAPFPAAILSPTDGSVIRFTPCVAGESGDITDTGAVLHEDDSGATLACMFYAPSIFTAGIPLAINGGGGIRLNRTSQRFYVGNTGSGAIHASVRTVSRTGVMGATTWTLGATGLTGLTASPDDTILYYAGAGGSGPTVYRWDLIGNSALSHLTTGVTGYLASDFLTLDDGSILVVFFKATLPRGTVVQHLSPAGTVLRTYDFGTNIASTSPKLAYALDHPNSFWIWTHQSSPKGLSIFTNVQVSDGTALATVTSPEYEGGTYQPIPTATPIRFGNSFSCPFFILRTAPPIDPSDPGAIERIRRLRQAPHLWDGTSGHRLKYPGFQLLVEAGAPRDTDGPMSWVLQWSDDGGHSWSHEHRIEGSRLGEHTFRFWWRRLGQSRDRVFRVVNSDDAKIVIIDALLVPDPVEGSS